MVKLVNLKNRDGEIIYPKSHIDAIGTSSNITLSESLNTITSDITSMNTKVINLEINNESLTEKSTQVEKDVKDLDDVLNSLIEEFEDYQASLSNVNNTSDLNKPISTATQNALNTKANSSDLSTHTSNTTNHITAAERTSWNSAKTHADSTHAPSNAQANQNAFSNVVVGSTTVSADTPTDTLTLVAGNNVTLTPDATNDKITIASKNTVYTHPNYTEKANGLYKITVDNTGHVSQVSNVVKDDITALGIPAQDTTYTLNSFGITASSDEINYCDGVTSNIQTQLNGKAASSHGTHVTYGTSATALGTSAAGTASTVSRSDHVHALPALTSCTGTLTVAKGGTGATTPEGALTNLGITATAAELNTLDGITATVAELNYCDGVTSNIQTQLNTKSANTHTHSKLVDIGGTGYKVELSAAGVLTIYDKNNTAIWNSKDVSLKKSDLSGFITFSNVVETTVDIG